jgi:hypothetical protein
MVFIFACKSEQKNDQQTKSDAKPTGVTYQVPDGWVEEEPENAMRKAQYRLPGVSGADDAKLTVFVFPGSGGTVDANINRWYRQFKQPDGSDSAQKAKVKNISVNNLQVTMIFLSGTYIKSMAPILADESQEVPNSALMAAIVETGSSPWFFKAVGPEITILHWQQSFDQFVQSFTYHK